MLQSVSPFTLTQQSVIATADLHLDFESIDCNEQPGAMPLFVEESLFLDTPIFGLGDEPFMPTAEQIRSKEEAMSQGSGSWLYQSHPPGGLGVSSDSGQKGLLRSSSSDCLSLLSAAPVVSSSPSHSHSHMDRTTPVVPSEIAPRAKIKNFFQPTLRSFRRFKRIKENDAFDFEKFKKGPLKKLLAKKTVAKLSEDALNNILVKCWKQIDQLPVELQEKLKSTALQDKAIDKVLKDVDGDMTQLPDWLHANLKIAALGIYTLDLSYATLNAQKLEKIVAVFSNVFMLTLRDCNLRDSALQHIAKLKDLVSLDLSVNRLTDKGLAYLAPLKNLIELNLSSCPFFEGAGFTTFESLDTLTELTLSGCSSLLDEGLNAIGVKFSALTTLKLEGCREISDAGLKGISKLTSLKKLALDNCDITDQAAIHIVALPSLKELSLTNCQEISDKCLEILGKHTKLTKFDLSCCDGITEKGIKKLVNTTLQRKIDVDACMNVQEEPIINILECYDNVVIEGHLRPKKDKAAKKSSISLEDYDF
jgi:hypothetical protein